MRSTSVKLGVVAGLVGGAMMLGLAARAEESTPGNAVVVPLAASRRVPRPVVEMADSKLAEKLTGRGYKVVDAKAVESMKSLLRFPREPQAGDWARLGRSLLAEIVVGAS